MAYAYYGTVTIDHTKCGTASSNDFPVFVSLSHNDLKTVANGGKMTSASGYDLVFWADVNFSNSMAFEIDNYDGAAGTYEAYVKVPSISSSTDVVFYFTYANSSVTTSQESIANTWANGFADVWHFRNGSVLDVASSLASIALTNSGCTATTGLVGQGAISYSGTSTLLNSSASDVPAYPYALEIWFKPTSVTTLQNLFDVNSTNITMTLRTTSKVRMSVAGLFTDSTATITANTTHYAAMSMASPTSRTLYLDNGAGQTDVRGGVFQGSPYLAIGSTGGGQIRFTGVIDEVRISNLDRSASWILATYNNLNSPSTFTTNAYANTIVASNSGDIAAANAYSGAAFWNGTNRMLSIDVAILSSTRTVTALTYGGATCTLVGAISKGAQRLEQWRICSSDAGAPASGSNTLAATLSGSAEFAVLWVNRQGVHQTTPLEAFASASGTNAGVGNNATVTITTQTNNSTVHAACVSDDISITAGQTSRNNVAGTSGSGADEDPNAVTSPIAAVAMTYTGLGTTANWAMAGYAIRPDTAGIQFKYEFYYHNNTASL